MEPIYYEAPETWAWIQVLAMLLSGATVYFLGKYWKPMQ